MRRRPLPGRAVMYVMVLFGLLTAVPRVSTAQRRWLKLDRVEAEPSWVRGIVKLRAYVSAVNVYGGTIPIPHSKRAWALQVSGKKLRSATYSVPFTTQSDVLLLGIVIQTSKEKPVDASQPHSLTEVRPALIHFIEQLPKTTRIALVTYAEQVEGGRRLQSLTSATSNVRKLAPSKQRQANLTKAVAQALKALNKYKPKGAAKDIPVRRALLIIGDGRDSQWPKPKDSSYDTAREEVSKLAKLANRSQIRIHAIGYSAENWHRPMLTLGELAKRSHGTLRLALSYDSFEVSLRSLLNEMQRQHVLTFYVSEKRVKGRKIQLLSGKLVSNPVRLKKITCGAQVCASNEYCGTSCVPRHIKDGVSILRWAMYIGGGVVGLLALLMGVGFLLSRRQQTPAAPPLQQAMPDDEPAQAQPPHPQRVQGAANPYAPNAQQNPPQQQQQQQQQQAQRRGPIQPQANPYAAQQMTPGQPNRPARRSHVAVAGPTLLVIKGEQKGQTFPLRHNFQIGKAGQSDLAIPNDPYASTNHAYIQMDRGGNCTLVDNQSTNGTFVNGVRVTGQHRLTSGMLIRIGATELRFLTQ